jgi:hypothetical protein
VYFQMVSLRFRPECFKSCSRLGYALTGHCRRKRIGSSWPAKPTNKVYASPASRPPMARRTENCTSTRYAPLAG